MALYDELVKDADNMENIMCKTADRCDLWQDRFIYAMAKAIFHIITYLVKTQGR